MLLLWVGLCCLLVVLVVGALFLGSFGVWERVLSSLFWFSGWLSGRFTWGRLRSDDEGYRLEDIVLVSFRGCGNAVKIVVLRFGMAVGIYSLGAFAFVC